MSATETMYSRLRNAPRVPEGQARRDFLVEHLEARLATLPVIEQAKGILMAHEGCTPEQAFDMLRRASQRKNQKVRDLAQEIVAAHQVASGRAGRQPPPAPSSRAG